MKILRKKLIHLHRCRGVTRRIIRHMLAVNPTLQDLYQSTISDLHHTYNLPFDRATILHADLHDTSIHQALRQDIQAFSILTFVDDAYPQCLKTIPDPPILLYALGDLSLLYHQPALSVIGTRQPSTNAYQKMSFVLQPLLEQDFLIISGMAKGIDGFAHLLTLQANKKTIAVLGGGFHSIYPKQHETLFRHIIDKGLVLSEYSPDTFPKRYHFPERNRIISGLSFGTLVIEASERSGTLITVDQALEQGREVFAVPDSPLIKQTMGCHRLIQDGAKLVMNARDILDDWEALKSNYESQNQSILLD